MSRTTSTHLATHFVGSFFSTDLHAGSFHHFTITSLTIFKSLNNQYSLHSFKKGIYFSVALSNLLYVTFLFTSCLTCGRAGATSLAQSVQTLTDGRHA